MEHRPGRCSGRVGASRMQNVLLLEVEEGGEDSGDSLCNGACQSTRMMVWLHHWRRRPSYRRSQGREAQVAAHGAQDGAGLFEIGTHGRLGCIVRHASAPGHRGQKCIDGERSGGLAQEREVARRGWRTRWKISMDSGEQEDGRVLGRSGSRGSPRVPYLRPLAGS